MNRKLPGANGPASRRSTICRSRPAGKGRIRSREVWAVEKRLGSPGGRRVAKGRDCERWAMIQPPPSGSIGADCLQPERRSKFGRNHGCSRATIVADPQHLANIWVKGGLAIACAAFLPHPSVTSYVGKNCRFVREGDGKFGVPRGTEVCSWGNRLAMDVKTSIKKRLPSRHVTEGPERAPHRSYLYAMGLTSQQIHQPFVGVASCWNEAAPCNISLMRQAQAVKKGV